MLLYIILLSLSLFSIGYCEIGGHRKYRKILFYLLFLYAVLLAGLRYRVGGDTIIYMDDYADLPTLSELSIEDFFYQQTEPFYLLLCVLVRMISPEFYLFQLIHALLVNFAVFRFFKKYSNYPFIGLFIYFLWFYFIFNYEFLRESLAVSVMLLAYGYYQNKRWKKYYACATIALMFHMSAIIAFVFPLLRNLRFNRRFMAYALGGIALFVLLKSSMQSGISLFPYLDAKIWYYFHMPMSAKWCIQQAIPTIVVPAICLIYHRMRQDSNIPFESLICIRILLGLGILFMPVIFYRFGNYTVLPFLLLLANIIGPGLRQKVSVNQFLTSGLCLFFTVILFAVFYFTPVSSTQRAYIRYIPYYSVLNPERYQPREKVLAERQFYDNELLENE